MAPGNGSRTGDWTLDNLFHTYWQERGSFPAPLGCRDDLEGKCRFSWENWIQVLDCPLLYCCFTIVTCFAAVCMNATRRKKWCAKIKVFLSLVPWDTISCVDWIFLFKFIYWAVLTWIKGSNLTPGEGRATRARRAQEPFLGWAIPRLPQQPKDSMVWSWAWPLCYRETSVGEFLLHYASQGFFYYFFFSPHEV